MFTLSALSPYKLLIEVVALVSIVIASYAGLHAFERHFINIGENNIKIKFDKYVKEQNDLVLIANAKNTVLRNQADKNLVDLKLHYDKNLSDLNIDNVKLKKDLQNALPRIANLLANAKLHKAGITPSSSTVPKDEVTPQLPTESGADCNGTLAIVTEAGKSCALDYDALYNAWESECTASGGCI